MLETHQEELIDLSNTLEVIDCFNSAAKANLDCPFRSNSVIDLPDEGRLLVTGDIHDNYRNFHKSLKLAKLGENDCNHIVLQELIHGEYFVNGKDLSIRILAQAAALKVNYPNQVHHILSNHELTQISNNSIIKNSINVVEAFRSGVEMLYGNYAEQITKAMAGYIRSLPLAVRCTNGILCSHSLPYPKKLIKFDTSILDRKISADDLIRNGAAHMIVWGRRHDQQTADQLAQVWDAKIFVLGHQHAEMGYFCEGDSILVIASDHNHGMALPIDLSKPAPPRDELIEKLVPLAGVF